MGRARMEAIPAEIHQPLGSHGSAHRQVHHWIFPSHSTLTVVPPAIVALLAASLSAPISLLVTFSSPTNLFTTFFRRSPFKAGSDSLYSHRLYVMLLKAGLDERISLHIPSIPHTLLWLGAASCLAALFCLHVYPTYISSLRQIKGPPSSNPLFGNVIELFTQDSAIFDLSWSRIFGQAFSIRWAFGETRLYISDPSALHHVLVTNCYAYPKPDQLRAIMSGAMGKGIMFAEGEDHRRQRKVVGPAFGLAANRQYAHIFHDKARELRERWLSILASSEEPTIEVSKWIAACTTDVIGLAGFNHAYHALSTSECRLVDSLNGVIGTWDASMTGVLQRAISLRFPWLLNVAAKLSFARAIAVKKCLSIMEEDFRDIFGATAYHHDGEARDLISNIQRANSHTARPKDRLSDAEMMGQVSTVAIAGLETTATATTWALCELSRNERVQKRLRQEIHDIIEYKGDDDFNEDDFCKMVYLDAFIREVLRFYPPVESTLREAAKDDLIPLSEPILTRDGRWIDHIPVNKGQRIFIGVLAHNRNKAIWGDDADSFVPERWLEYDEETGQPGSAFLIDSKGAYRPFTTWSSSLSFLGGPRGCVGYRFALREMKTILSVLVNTFRFEPRDKDVKIVKRTTFMARPVVEGEESLGNQLPLKVTLLARE